jgi:chemotaxis protein MotA
MLLVVGIVVAFGAMMGGLILEGGKPMALFAIPSIVLVFFGTFGVTIAAFGTKDVLKMPGVMIKSITGKVRALDDQIRMLMELADVARKEGHLSLEGKIGDIDDGILRQGITLLVDGADEDRIREELESALAASSARHQKYKSILEKAAGYSPIMGLMGTTMGLINMLGHLDEPDHIGHSLAVAMTATFYGLVLANVVCTPIADKLVKLDEAEMMLGELTIDGVCAMLHGLSGRAMSERLCAWLPPKEREAVGK